MKPVIKWVGATDYKKGRNGYKPIAIVNHIMAGTMGGTRSHFNNPNDDIYVSAHFGVSKKGEIEQYVQLSDTAYHAGVVKNPSWTLFPNGINPNLVTIGIEHEGYPDDGLTEAQYEATLELHKWLIFEEIPRIFGVNIEPTEETIIGHYRINSVDKANCPGQNFPFQRLIADIQNAKPYAILEEVQVKIGDHRIRGWIPKGVNRTLVELRELSRIFDAPIHWDEKERIATLALESDNEMKTKMRIYENILKQINQLSSL